MATDKTVYTFEGDADDLIAAVRQASKALDSLGDTAKKTDKAVDSVSKGGGKASKSLASVKSAAPKVSAAFNGLATAAQGVGGKTGEMAGKMSAFASAAPMLANPIGIAVAAFAGLAVGIGVVVGGMVAAVFAADELNEELTKFKDIEGFEPIPIETLQQIETVNNSLGALTAIFQKLVVEVGANVAPTIEKASIVLVKFGLMALDAFQSFAKGKSLLFEFANFMVKEFVQALAAPIDQLMHIMWYMGKLATAMGLDGMGGALISVSDKWESFTDGIARTITGGLFSAAEGALDSVSDSTSDYDARARQLIKTIGADDGEGLTKAIKEQEKVVRKLDEAWKALLKESGDVRTALEKISEANNKNQSASVKATKAYRKQRDALDTLEAKGRLNLALINKEIEQGLKRGKSYQQMTELLAAQGIAVANLQDVEFQRLQTLQTYEEELLKTATSEEELEKILKRIGKARQRYAESLDASIAALREKVDADEASNRTSEETAHLVDELITLEMLRADLFSTNAEIREKAQKRLNEILEGEVSALKEAANLTGELAEGMSDLEDPTGVFRDILGETSLLFDRLDEFKGDGIKGAFAGIGAGAQAMGQIFGSVIDTIISQNEDLSHKQKKNLKILFALEKGAAITSIIMNTAAAMMKAVAQLGPIAGGIAATAIGIMGGVQLGVVAAAPPPFHVGGIIPQGAGMASVLPGESVLTREATAQLGAEGVASLNSGGGASSPVIVVNQYKHRIFDDFVADNIAKGGPLASAIRGKSKVGRSRALVTIDNGSV